jgi:hypothetical protein
VLCVETVLWNDYRYVTISFLNALQTPKELAYNGNISEFGKPSNLDSVSGVYQE